MKRTLYVDADTILYAAASMQQSNQCLARLKSTGKEHLFKNKTEFNTWLAKQTKFGKEDFEFEVVSSLHGKPEFAFQTIKQKIDNIFNKSYCDDFYVCIQGEGNFRKDFQTTLVDYKGHRTAKPILFNECFEYMKKKYKDRCIVAEGIETDDLIVTKSWESYNIALENKKRSEAPYVIAYCDKDIVANGRGWMLNYMKLEDGISWVDGITQTRNFFTQVLVGDTADNIPGIVKVSDDTKKQFGITTKGVGPATAAKILGDCAFEVEMARNVLEAYKSAWPNDWKDRLEANCFFLYLQRHEGDMFNIDEFFGRYSITL